MFHSNSRSNIINDEEILNKLLNEENKETENNSISLSPTLPLPLNDTLNCKSLEDSYSESTN